MVFDRQALPSYNKSLLKQGEIFFSIDLNIVYVSYNKSHQVNRVYEVYC
jgi:hypothetical protein